MSFNNASHGKQAGSLLSHLPSFGTDGNKIDDDMIFGMISKVLANDYKGGQVDSDNIQKKIDRPFSAPPPGLSFVEPNDENKTGLLYDPYYCVYYYSQKPHDPRLPRPMINQWEAKLILSRKAENKEEMKFHNQDYHSSANNIQQHLEHMILSDHDEELENLNQNALASAGYSAEHGNVPFGGQREHQIFAPRPLEGGAMTKVPSNTTSPLGYRQSPALLKAQSPLGIPNTSATTSGYQNNTHQMGAGHLSKVQQLQQHSQGPSSTVQNRANYNQLAKPTVQRPKPSNAGAMNQGPVARGPNGSGRGLNNNSQMGNQRGQNQNALYQSSPISSSYQPPQQGQYPGQYQQPGAYQQQNQRLAQSDPLGYMQQSGSLLPAPIQLKQMHYNQPQVYGGQMQGQYMNNNNFWPGSSQILPPAFIRQGHGMGPGMQELNDPMYANNSYPMMSSNSRGPNSVVGGGMYNASMNTYGSQPKTHSANHQHGHGHNPAQGGSGNNFNMGAKFGMGSGGKGNYNKQMQNNNFVAKEKIDFATLQGKIFEQSKDQNGSRQVQQYFEQGGEEEKERVWDEIHDRAYQLMKDVFGNYVIQKILEKGEEKMKIWVYEKMKDNILDLTMNTYGCRVVQKALEVLRTRPEIQAKIINEFRGQILSIVQDPNGNHVIQKSFESINSKNMEFVIEEIIQNLDTLAFHSSGCRVIQKILEFSPVEKTVPILNKLMDNIIKLCECQYGNYIMQHIIEKGPEKEKEKLLETVKANFVSLSSNKFASNVTEKSIICSHPSFRQEVLHLLMRPSPGNPNDCGLFQMMKDAYGNYVIQRLYEQSDLSSKTKVYQKISQSPEAIEDLKKSNYGKHVLSCIEKSYNESSNKN